ncbi:DUF6714 family protein [Undibacterium sp. Di27W]|uniref:DUF6714 family protein n=1 Tax=Undibacterium sp. Di27W TaxID=3413036 RepID=UPI003BF28CA2
MYYPTQKDIDDARAAGYDEAIIEQAQRRISLGLRAVELRQEIQYAFAGVQLGDGIGLYEARGIDHHVSEEDCAACRANDEKTDWRRIKLEDLNRCNSSLSFFDAAGMRFHLPAFMQADLGEDVEFDLIYHLVFGSQLEELQALLNDTQKAVVINYLKLQLDDVYQRHHWDTISDALLGYWNQ